MPSNFTENYQLNQWDAEDRVLRTDFNEDNAKIDAAIAAVSGRVDSLTASKADASTVAALTQTVAGKGNCQFMMGTYVGTGTVGKANPNTITFPKKPLVVFLCSPDWGSATAVYGTISAGVPSTYSNELFTLSWTENSLAWYCTATNVGASSQFNESGKTYHYFALMEA